MPLMLNASIRDRHDGIAAIALRIFTIIVHSPSLRHTLARQIEPMLHFLILNPLQEAYGGSGSHEAGKSSLSIAPTSRVHLLLDTLRDIVCHFDTFSWMLLRFDCQLQHVDIASRVISSLSKAAFPDATSQRLALLQDHIDSVKSIAVVISALRSKESQSEEKSTESLSPRIEETYWEDNDLESRSLSSTQVCKSVRLIR